MKQFVTHSTKQFKKSYKRVYRTLKGKYGKRKQKIPMHYTEKKKDIYQQENDQIESILVIIWVTYT